MIDTFLMKFARTAALVLVATSLSSCSTFLSLISSPPVMMLDQAASSMLGLLSENELPAGGKPQSIQERARQVQAEGMYAGSLGAKKLPTSKVAAR
jgi:hypothetical protein